MNIDNNRLRDIAYHNRDVEATWESQLNDNNLTRYWAGIDLEFILDNVHPRVELIESKLPSINSVVGLSHSIFSDKYKNETEKVTKVSEIESISDEGIFEFATWYLLNRDKSKLEYLKSRGITENAIKRNSIGSTQTLLENHLDAIGARVHPQIREYLNDELYLDGIIFPVKAHGKVYGTHIRNTGNSRRFMKWSSSCPMALIDNWYDATNYDTIFLVENIFDRIAISDNLGYGGVISLNNAIPSIVQMAVIHKLASRGHKIVTIQRNDSLGLHSKYLVMNYLKSLDYQIRTLNLSKDCRSVAELITKDRNYSVKDLVKLPRITDTSIILDQIKELTSDEPKIISYTDYISNSNTQTRITWSSPSIID
ncbi:hypothetical protein SP15_282 [Bacillus phage SP-15]|uniref:DNA primase n=1 Tax=Bacillus phage SP-15 TaxID=1792032 RepID=A0A127AWU8_9CAUD|nr:hypothetical protein SP15_282 [Bacillus phage SP-15]AMM45090.1 hypothetical protein SP15_282 [Bacillus phage SP-15]